MADLKDLVEQLGYLDHEHDTDLAGDLTELIGIIREKQLDRKAAEKLLKNQIKLMDMNSVFVDGEQHKLMETAAQAALDVLFA